MANKTRPAQAVTSRTCETSELTKQAGTPPPRPNNKTNCRYILGALVSARGGNQIRASMNRFAFRQLTETTTTTATTITTITITN